MAKCQKHLKYPTNPIQPRVGHRSNRSARNYKSITLRRRFSCYASHRDMLNRITNTVFQSSMNPLLPTLLLFTGICLAAEPSDRIPLQIPAGAVQVDGVRISFPLAHKARSADLLFKKLAGGKDFCVLTPDQASDLAGAQYKKVNGLETILVKWSFIEPVDEKELHSVIAHAPTIYSKDDVLYVSSSGIAIGRVGKVVDGVLIVQVAKLPKEIVHKLSRIGW